jgi:hypothetical protein
MKSQRYLVAPKVSEDGLPKLQPETTTNTYSQTTANLKWSVPNEDELLVAE